MTLGRDWLWALVRYAPSIESLWVMFSDARSIVREHAAMLLPAVGQWVRGVDWRTVDDIKALASLCGEVDHLRSPYIAGALLRNATTDRDDDKFIAALLGFTTTCAATAYDVDSKSKSGMAEFDAKEAALTELESAAKDWFRRNHCNEPEPEKKEQPTQGMFGGYSFYPPDKPKPPSQAELDSKRLKALNRAIDVLDNFFKIPYFEAKPHVCDHHCMPIVCIVLAHS